MTVSLLRPLILAFFQFGVLASATALATAPDQVAEAKELVSIPEISATLLGVVGMLMLVIRRRR